MGTNVFLETYFSAIPSALNGEPIPKKAIVFLLVIGSALVKLSFYWFNINIAFLRIPLITCLGLLVASLLFSLNWKVFLYSLNAKNEKANLILNKALMKTNISLIHEFDQFFEIYEHPPIQVCTLYAYPEVLKE